MNIILLHPDEVRSSSVILHDRRAEHIRKILGAKEGDRLRVGIIDGPMGSALVLGLSRHEVRLRVNCQDAPPVKIGTDLILALPRPIMLKRVLAQAAAMGVGRIMLINARRVEKSFFQASLLQPDRIQTALLQGLEQAMDTRLPVVSIHPRFRPFVEDQLPAIAVAYPLRLLGHPPAAAGSKLTSQAITGLHAPAHAHVTAKRQLLAVGPEGGWVDFEVERFRQQGFNLFSPGPRILRVDTAVAVLLALAEAGHHQGHQG
ncbi:MAG: 16S rRNA (uracil(1498)-N(3))-methyltransferase [Desulfobulbaceae bacterium]|nr:MAG: 16S rRNA (uracil(1498)-N(3))-methyltransferase [Desulfobulbaceae bacterium]